MPSVADFLIERLANSGVKHVFGVPGDYVLGFYKRLSDSPDVEIINTTDENHAGFAADAYARVHGIGAVCVTYNVGALKIANAVACAYAERSPIVVISGSPGLKERDEGFLLHHMVRSFECQRKVFENITCASVVLDDLGKAGYAIDRVLCALQHYKQPVYIELPRDVAEKPVGYDVYTQGTPSLPQTDVQNLEEALAETVQWIESAKKPVILAGVQLARYGLGTDLVKFAEKKNIPILTDLSSKSVVSEKHRLFAGSYLGNVSSPTIRQLVDESDCILMFGVLLTDMTLCFRPVKFSMRNTVSCSVEGLKVRNHLYENVHFKDFCTALFKAEVTVQPKGEGFPKKDIPSFVPRADKKITVIRLFEKINSILNDNYSIIADIGDSLFGASDLTVHNKNTFLGSAFYASMGYAIPGALGMSIAQPDKRVIVVVGDGAFQMSCTELSTLVAKKLNSIIFVLNNRGYTTERFLIDGPFNDVPNWNYHKITETICGGKGVLVDSEEGLERAVADALKSRELFIINVMLDPMDISPALKRMTDSLSQRM